LSIPPECQSIENQITIIESAAEHRLPPSMNGVMMGSKAVW
jgi:hypothetical protein